VAGKCLVKALTTLGQCKTVASWRTACMEKNLYAHRRKSLKYRAVLKQRAEMEHWKRLKRLGGYLKTSNPSPSSGKSKSFGWRTIIEGGAVEKHRRRH
jgi:hypothetical protein